MEQGRVHEQNAPNKENHKRALAAYGYQCETSNGAEGCLELGRLYLYSEFVQDTPRAFYFLNKAFEHGNSEACRLLARMRRLRLAGESDTGAQFEQQVLNGQMDECIGDLYHYGWFSKVDFNKAREHYEEAAAVNPAAKAALGELYLDGLGVPENENTALMLFTASCETAKENCANLGMLLESGRGVSRDIVAALKYYTEACDNQQSKGCVRLGLLHQHGNGVPTDISAAMKLYKKGCRLLDRSACAHQAALYDSGKLEKNVDEQAEAAMRACMLGQNAGTCAERFARKGALKAKKNEQHKTYNPNRLIKHFGVLPTMYLGLGTGIGGKRHHKDNGFQLDFVPGLRFSWGDEYGLLGLAVAPEIGYTLFNMPAGGHEERIHFFRVGGMIMFTPGGGIRFAYQSGEYQGEPIHCVRNGLVLSITSVAFVEVSYQRMTGATVPEGWEHMVSVSWNLDTKWIPVGVGLLISGVPGGSS